jgi:hypothetical protein
VPIGCEQRITDKGYSQYESVYAIEKGDVRNDLVPFVTMCAEATNGRMEFFDGVSRDPSNRVKYLLDYNQLRGCRHVEYMIKEVIEPKLWCYKRNDFDGPYDFLADLLSKAHLYKPNGKCPIETFQFTEDAF